MFLESEIYPNLIENNEIVFPLSYIIRNTHQSIFADISICVLNTSTNSVIDFYDFNASLYLPALTNGKTIGRLEYKYILIYSLSPVHK